jgi:hypothetical protein
MSGVGVYFLMLYVVLVQGKKSDVTTLSAHLRKEGEKMSNHEFIVSHYVVDRLPTAKQSDPSPKCCAPFARPNL